MIAQDRRVKRTQQLLARALIALTLEKGYEAVTIRDITERAGVGYATFFRHYRDKDGLLQDVLDVVLEEIIGLLAPALDHADQAEVGAVLFRYVQAQSEMVRVLVGSRAVVQRLINDVALQVASDHGEQPGSVVPVEIAAHHIVSATINLVEWWLDHAMPYTPERMGLIYSELIAEPTSRLAFGSEG